MTGKSGHDQRVERQRDAWRSALTRPDTRAVLQQIRDWCGGARPLPVGGPEASAALGQLEIGRKIDQAIREVDPMILGIMAAEFDAVPKRKKATEATEAEE